MPTRPTRFFTAPGKFHRGNLHTHSTRSDGVLEPEEVCRRYQAEGYDFIALTDHFVGLYDYPVVDTSAFRNAEFTTLFGVELHSGALENNTLWHLVAVGLPLDFAPGNAPHFSPVSGSESGAEIAARARAAGAFVAIAHPHWSGMTEVDAASIEAAHAIEIYNHGCTVECDRGDGLLTCDHLLNSGRRVTMIATDDAHFATPDHFGGWVMVKATENSPEALLAALKAGEFYASTGPEIHDIRVSEDFVEVDCSPISSAGVIGEGTNTTSQFGEGLVTVRLPLNRLKKSPWIRVVVIDAAQKRAWSNPIWIND